MAQPQGEPRFLRPADLSALTSHNDISSPSAPQCLLYCFILYLCSFFTAYEQGITNGFLALPAFVEAFGPVMPSSSGSGSGSGAGKHYVNTSLQQLLFVVSDLGWLSTLCVAWLLYERVGRVRVLQIGLATSIAAIVLATAAPNRETFLTARFFIGGGVGFISSASFLWVGESTVAHIVSSSGPSEKGEVTH